MRKSNKGIMKRFNQEKSTNRGVGKRREEGWGGGKKERSNGKKYMRRLIPLNTILIKQSQIKKLKQETSKRSESKIGNREQTHVGP